MNTRHNERGLQPVTPEALIHIHELAAKNSVGIEERCARYRRRGNFRRVAVASCLFALFILNADTAFATPTQYTWIKTNGTIDEAYTCEVIDLMLRKE